VRANVHGDDQVALDVKNRSQIGLNVDGVDDSSLTGEFRD